MGHAIIALLVARGATLLADFFAKNLENFRSREMQKKNLDELRFHPCKVRLNIEKLRKLDY